MKHISMKNIIKSDAFVHFFGYIFSALGAFLGIAFLSHIVPPDKYGIFALYISIAALAQHIFRETTGNALLRYSEPIIRNKKIVFFIIKKNIPGLLMALSLISISSFFWFNDHSIQERLLSIALCVFFSFGVLGETLLSSLLMRAACAVYININQWLRFFLAAFFYLYVSPDVSGFILGFLLTFALSFSFAFFTFERTAIAEPGLTIKADIFTGASPYLIGLISWYFVFFDRIVIERLLGEELLGVYFVLIQIGFMPIVTLLHAMASYLFPLLFHNEKRSFTKISMILGAGVCSGFLVLIFLHEWIFSWLVGAEYRAYSWLLPWMYIAAVIHTMAYLFQSKFFEKGGLNYLLRAQVITAVIGLFLMVGFTIKLQLAGAVFARVGISLLLILFSIFVHKKLQQENSA